MTMSNRIAVMRDGKIEQLGSARGPVRAPGDAIRGRLPGRFEPARRQGRGQSTATARTWSSAVAKVRVPRRRLPATARGDASACGPRSCA